jgi:hypothetical protein
MNRKRSPGRCGWRELRDAVKLAVASLIRNEIDIIGGFLQHLDALFDYALLMDHGSIDGTDHAIAAACTRRTGWDMWHVEPVGYHQTAFNGFALRHLFQHTDADVVMFLDVDEFINVPDRGSLVAAFARLTDADSIGELVLRNAVPGRTDTRAISPGEPIWLPSAAGRFGKVVIPRHFYARHGTEARLGIGNHFLYYPPAKRVRAERVGEILHLPIRSHAQLRNKVLAGVFSVMAQVQRRPAQCWHWYDILDRIGEGTFRDEDLVGIAVHYGERGSQSSTPVSWVELPDNRFNLTALNVAFGRPLPPIAEPLAMDPVRLIASVARRFQMEDLDNGDLVLEADRLRFVPRENRT